MITTDVTAYPETAVVTIEQLACALQISVRQAERLNLPAVYLGTRTRRYVWGQVLETLRQRAA